MKNCLIFGSGRSGTSMVSGMLHDAGYYMGDDLYPARHSNPKGFFENSLINNINESILSNYDSWKYKILRNVSRKSSIYAPSKGQRWLMSILEDTVVDYENKHIVKGINDALSKGVFSYKDPRFAYTLRIWEKYLPEDTRYVVVFREPSRTVNSIIKECNSVDYLRNLKINERLAYESWLSLYSYILSNYDVGNKKFLFIHYEQVLSGEALKVLSDALSCSITDDFVDKNLKRSSAKKSEIELVAPVYSRLCELANYDD